jgi:alpha(1,3/1,4) fucosyltransferase
VISRPSVALFIDPPTYHFERDRLFQLDSAPVSGDRILEPYLHLRRRLAQSGVATHTGDMLARGEVDTSDVNLYVTTGIRHRYKALRRRGDVVLSAFIVPECPIANPPLFDDLYEASGAFRRVYSFSSDEALRPFLRGPVTFRPCRYPYPFDAVDEQAWSRRDRRFLAMINANKVPVLKTNELYSERLRALSFFAGHGEIDLFGVGWDGPPFRIGTTRTPPSLQRLRYELDKVRDRVRPDPLLMRARSVYRGPVTSKAETLAGYTFAICFENQVLEGWVTEKIFDCLVAGAIPVYLGAPDIERWVTPECFIDMRRFSSYEELRAFLHELSPREIETYREAGREYFRSDQFRPFSKEAFADLFAVIVSEDAGITV